MATQEFDYFSVQEKPAITLCNPDHSQLFSLGACYNTEVKLKWNAQSEISFEFPRTVDGTDLSAFDYLEGKRVILVDTLGYFIISGVQEDDDGSVPIKSITALSIDSELVYKKINVFSGTYKFYDSGSGLDDSLLGTIINLIPNWSLGSIDSSLVDLYRTFDISDSNVYQFLTTDVSNAYSCVFIFDYTDRTISAILSDQSPAETDIFLSKQNLVDKAQYKEIVGEITTAMYCYGGGDLTIRNVNPLGTNAIYDFTYYKTTEWMTQDLIDAITTWETKVTSYQSDYSGSVVLLATNQSTLLIQQARLAEYQSQLVSHQQVRDAMIQRDPNADTTEIDAQIVADQQNINNENVLIAATNATILSLQTALININLTLAFTNTANFTNAQYLELNNFIFENTYHNDNIIITDSMTPSEIQVQSMQLYNNAVDILAKAAIPRYQITIDAVNFFALQEFQPFIDQLTLGCQITVDTGKGYYIDAALLEYDYNYEDPTNFTITISNRQRLDDSHFIFTDLFGQTVQSSNTVKFNNNNWNDWLAIKPTVINSVITPSGGTAYGIVGANLAGTINAQSTLAIQNTNATTGSQNIYVDQYGITLRDASIYSGSNLGIDDDIVTAGGGAIYFRGGIYVGSTGLAPGSTVSTLEDLTGTSGSYFSLSKVFLVGTLRVFINGILQRLGYTYSEGGDTQSFTTMENIPATDILEAEYISLS